MVFATLLIWVVFWFLVWAGIFYLISKGVDYISHPFLFSIYFLFFSLFPIYFFRQQFLPLLEDFSILPFIVLFLVLVVTLLIYHITRKYLRPPTKLIKRYPNSVFLRIDSKYVIPKSFEILFQQSLIIVFVILLSSLGLNMGWLMLTFAIFFGAIHAFLIKTEGLVIGSYFTVTSILGGLLFPPVILLLPYGFVYSYTLHWFFYSFSPVLFWKFYGNRR